MFTRAITEGYYEELLGLLGLLWLHTSASSIISWLSHAKYRSSTRVKRLNTSSTSAKLFLPSGNALAT